MIPLVCRPLAIAGVLASLALPAAAQWSPDSNVNNPVVVAADTQSPAIAVSDGAGGTIVVWKYARFDAGTFEFFYSARAQRLDAVGNPMWAAGGVALAGETLHALSTLVAPPMAAVADGAGGAIVAWRDARNDFGDIFAQRISGAGTLSWGATGLAIAAATGVQLRPNVIADGAGGAIFTWQDPRNGVGNTDVYAQRVNAAGVSQWAANGVAVCSESGDQLQPALVSDGAGGAILAWSDLRTGVQQIYAQRIDGAAGLGQWVLPGVLITATEPGLKGRPVLASDGASGAVVAWEDSRNGANNDVYAQRLSAAGAPLWTASGVQVASTDNAGTPAIVSDGAAGAIVAWVDDRNGASDVFAQRLDAAGAPQWTANGIAVCVAAGGQIFPAAVSDGAGGVILGWDDGRNGANDVFAQRLDGTGAALWAADGRPVSTAAADQSGVSVATDGAGGGIFAWADSRNAGTGIDVYAAHVNAAGALPVTLERFAIE
ncbi:MAG: hypothetical protein ABW221_13155 [Vicinamibacteria bacterium]